MTRERFNQHMLNQELSEKVFEAAKNGLWPVGLSENLVLVKDQEFGNIYAAIEAELSNGLYEVIRNDGTIECLVIGGEY